MTSCSRALYFLRRNWKILLGGQALSLLLASAGAAQATLHLDCGLSAPTFTMTFVYLGLSCNVVLLITRSRRRDTTRLLAQEEDGVHDGTVNATVLPPNDELSLSDNSRSESKDSTPNHKYKDAVVESSEDETASAVKYDRSLDEDEDPATSEETPRGYQSPICGGLIVLHQPPWWYFLLALLDVEANAITMLAFRYTTLTSVTLFDALAIPSAMIISRCWLQRQYQGMHYLGAVVCMMGVVANVLTDYESDVNNSESPEEAKEYPHKLRGDVCAILGGLLYGLGDVLAEYTITATGDITEYLAMMGSFAFVISLVQSLVLERDEIMEFFGEDDLHSATCSLQKGWLLLITFCGVTMLSYVGGSRFLLVSEAAFFNLSLLTGDLWSVVFSIVAEKIVPQPLFFAALVFVLSGVVLYEMAPSPAQDKQGNIASAEHCDGVITDVPNSGERANKGKSSSLLVEEDTDIGEGIEMR